ncbi:MAG: hypothetical protein WKF37_09710 [Bryobacteraceae bacterium]
MQCRNAPGLNGATPALRSGDFGGTGALIYDPATGNPDGSGAVVSKAPDSCKPADPAAQKMLALLPAPNQTVFPNNYFANGTYEFNRDNSDLKVNYNPTERARCLRATASRRAAS